MCTKHSCARTPTAKKRNPRTMHSSRRRTNAHARMFPSNPVDMVSGSFLSGRFVSMSRSFTRADAKALKTGEEVNTAKSVSFGWGERRGKWGNVCVAVADDPQRHGNVAPGGSGGGRTTLRSLPNVAAVVPVGRPTTDGRTSIFISLQTATAAVAEKETAGKRVRRGVVIPPPSSD